MSEPPYTSLTSVLRARARVTPRRATHAGPTSERDKSPGADQPRDLAREHLLVAAVEQNLFEQEAGGDVIALVLQLGGVALALGGPFPQLVELASARALASALAGPDRREQRAMTDDVRIAPDRRGEVAVARRAQSGVADVLRRVAGLLERAQHERAERDPAVARAAHVRVHAPGDVAHELRRLRGEERVGQRRRGHSERGELLDEPADALGIGALVDAVEAGDRRLREMTSDRFVGGDHQVLDQTVGLRLRARANLLDVAVLVEGELGLLGVDHERARALARLLQRRCGLARGGERRAPRLGRGVRSPAKMRSTCS